MSESLSTTAILSLSLIILALLALISSERFRRQRLRRQRTGIVWLQSLRKLLALVQQHRGMSNGVLNGDPLMQKEITPLQKSIKDGMTKIVAEDEWIETNELWQGISQHWISLAQGYARLSIENNLEQHNRLIHNIIYLIDDMAEAHDLLLLKGSNNQPLFVLWRELLTAAEYVGQSRAIGTGVTASGTCDSISRIRLHYLKQKVERNTQEVWSQIPPDAAQREKLGQLLLCISDDVVQEKPGIAAKDFWLLASEALNSLYEQYDHFVGEQQQRLNI